MEKWNIPQISILFCCCCFLLLFVCYFISLCPTRHQSCQVAVAILELTMQTTLVLDCANYPTFPPELFLNVFETVNSLGCPGACHVPRVVSGSQQFLCLSFLNLEGCTITLGFKFFFFSFSIFLWSQGLNLGIYACRISPLPLRCFLSSVLTFILTQGLRP